MILEVACEGDVISKSVIFEYKSPAGSTSTLAKTKKNPSLKERDLRTILLRKLESLDICTVDDKDIFLEQELDKEENFSEFEDQLVTMCQKLTSEDWTTDEGIASDIGHNSSTTLLHLGASLGLCRLVCSLLHWAAEHPGRRLGREVDALAKDSEGYTPLMRACANGKKEIATILYHWNSAAAKIKNKAGLTCVELAGKSSCPDFKQELEDLEEQKMLEQMESSSTITSESLSKKPKAEFLKPVEKITKKVIRAPSLEGHLNIPSNTRRSPSPLGTFGMRSASASVRNLRAASPASNQGEASGFKLKLTKQPSVDSGINLDVQAVKNIQKDIRQLSKNDRSLSLPSTGFQKTMSLQENPILVAGRSKVSKKETDGSVKSFENPDSPFIDVEAISSDDEDSNVIEPDPAKRPGGEDQSKEDQKVLTLAEQFLAAMPDRIKFESTTVDDDDDSMIFPDCCSSGGADCCSQSEDLGVESMADDQSVDFEFNFEEACQSYRDVSTPTSSLSPASFTLESPRSSFHESPSPCLSFNFDRRSPPTTAELSEFLQASAKCEKDLSNLTLSEMEQRELYQAAQIIQKAYRSYKGRKKTPTRPRVSPEGIQEGEDQAKEAKAAVVIQNYYRRYKQYCYWKQMAKAATLIQNKYRTYCEHKRFKKSQKAATCIQTYYRNYKEHQSQVRNRNSDEKESTPTAGLKRTYSQRRQHQAARKIQQFMRQTHLKLQTARVATHVEREKLPTLEFHMGCQQRCHMDITDMDTDMATMDMLDIIPCFQAGQGTTHTHQIPSQEQIKDSSASEDDHPEPKSYRKTYEKK